MSGLRFPIPTDFYPVTDELPRPSKVQPPALRDDILARPRLLDWLDAKIHRRVVAIVAEAGYGKTTLLADWSRRTRIRTAWYRLDDDDHDVITFIRYLLAACREVAPELGSRTASMLRDIGGLAIPTDVLVDTFLRELTAFGDEPAAIILDDVHSLDGAPEVLRVLRELIARAPDRVTIVLSGRRRPPVALARLRTLGEVAELGADDLRFDHDETEALFRDAYHQPLDRETLSALENRTEGWAASLQMVGAALRHRSAAETRRFIRELSGSQEQLYDYLAEVVVADLGQAQQSFLMFTALLTEVNVWAAAAAARVSREASAGAMALTERLGLLSRPSGRERRPAARYHPLVREFLVSRLRSEIGEDGIREAHRRIAAAAEASEWRLAAHHYAEAHDLEHVDRVLSSAIGMIMGSGDYAYAESAAREFGTGAHSPWLELVKSRVSLQMGRTEDALKRARHAVESATVSGDDRYLALANLMAVELALGDADAAHRVAKELRTSSDMGLRNMAVAMVAVLEASRERSIDDAIEHLEVLSSSQVGEDFSRFRGVSLLNLAYALMARGDVVRALATANEAADTLDSGSTSELANARVLATTARTHLDGWADDDDTVGRAIDLGPPSNRAEIEAECADLLGAYGDPVSAEVLLQSAMSVIGRMPAPAAAALTLVAGHNAVRLGDYSRAEALLRHSLSNDFVPIVAADARRQTARAHAAVAARRPDAATVARIATVEARAMGAGFWANYGELLQSLAAGPSLADPALLRLSQSDPGLVTLAADIVCGRLAEASPPVLEALKAVGARYPQRWRRALRTEVDRGRGASSLSAGIWLQELGEEEDIARLRALARRLGARAQGVQLARPLARRLAVRVFVEDQGPVHMRIGDRVVAGTELRRKVLSLLCFLLSRPRCAATREQVLEAMWPDLDPELGSNSLNQTVYFLRRVFEPNYREETSPAYLQSDSEMLWLDRDLVDSRSAACVALLRRARARDESSVDELAGTYRGRFALDFAYEEWAAIHRDSMHAGYLEVMERAILARSDRGDLDGAIRLARAVVDTDPSADSVEVALIRLYRLTGSHAAAAEQYAHYSSAQRSELGVDVPALMDL